MLGGKIGLSLPGWGKCWGIVISQ